MWRDVVVGRAAVVLGIEDVRQRDRAVVVGVQVDGAAERVRVQEREVVGRPALELHQQAVILEVAGARQGADGAQRRRHRGERPVDVLIGHADARRRLVEVDLEGGILGARAGVGRLDHVVRCRTAAAR